MTIDAEHDSQIQAQYADLADTWQESPASRYAAVADYFEVQGDTGRAISCLEMAANMDRTSARRLFLLARALIKAKRYREGGKILEEASELDSVELAGRTWAENNLYYIGYALFHVGRYIEAAEGLRGADNLIDTWGDALVLKQFHLHQGFCWHLEGRFLDAAECYRRAMVAPGPGDSCAEDEMDPNEVEEAQDYNEEIEPYMDLAQKGESLDASQLEVTPSFP